MTFAPLGDSAVVVTLGTTIDEATLLRVRALAAALSLETAAGIVDVVPAYTTVTIFYRVQPGHSEELLPYDRICRLVESLGKKLEHTWSNLLEVAHGDGAEGTASVIEIPVCYGGEFGPDIGEVARHTGLAENSVASLHREGKYLVHAVGFAPGFPYLGGLAEKLFTPRRPTPRTAVPAGSVGIGWKQTGIYPLTTPGGWQIIGRTPLPLFDPRADSPARLKVGDRVRFTAISEEEFRRWK